MSQKAFYQTFYQNEQLFRVDDQPFPVLRTEQFTVHNRLPKTPEIEPTTLAESVVPPVMLPETSSPVVLTEMPVSIPAKPILESAPVAVAPVIPEPADAPAPADRVEIPQPLEPTLPINHKVLILADEDLTPSDLLFLEKILKAVNLNMDGVELLNLHGVKHIDFAEVLRGKVINHFITFGVPFQRINLDIMMDRYAPVRFEGITFLMADSLPTVEADQNLKRALWNSLKRVFSL